MSLDLGVSSAVSEEPVGVTFYPVKPSIMNETSSLSKSAGNVIELAVHDHLPLIVDATPVLFRGSQMPKVFRSEWLVLAKSTSEKFRNEEMKIRLIITFMSHSHEISIKNYWLDDLTNNEAGISRPLLDYIHSKLDQLRERTIQQLEFVF